MTSLPDRFGVLVLTHGRPAQVKTVRTLRRQGYTGPVWLVVDNEDETRAEYERRYPGQVVVFDKAAAAATVDVGDNFPERRGVVYARNAAFQIARDLGLATFLELDDDYSSFVYKFTPDLRYKERPVKNLDRLLATFLHFYTSIPALTVAMAQNGDFIGGKASTRIREGVPLLRKAMNTFFCSTERPFDFMGRVNEDVCAYLTHGHRGGLLLTVPLVAIIQTTTQQAKGGLTEIYLDQGTYVKSFYSILYCPSFVQVGMMGEKHRRLHHHVTWNRAVPQLLHPRYQQPRPPPVEDRP